MVGFIGRPSRVIVRPAGVLQIPFNLRGTEEWLVGKPRDGVVPVVAKAASLRLEPVEVQGNCVCISSVEAKTCGGTLFEANGLLAEECTFDPSICSREGKPPCAPVHGPGNGFSGLIGCDGLAPANITWVQDAGGQPPPPPPTPPVGAGPPIVTMHSTGPAGTALFFATRRIGTFLGSCAPVPTPTPGGTPVPFPPGPDGRYCTDDDPEEGRGSANTIPLVSGRAEIWIENSYNPGPPPRIEYIPPTPPAVGADDGVCKGSGYLYHRLWPRWRACYHVVHC